MLVRTTLQRWPAPGQGAAGAARPRCAASASRRQQGLVDVARTARRSLGRDAGATRLRRRRGPAPRCPSPPRRARRSTRRSPPHRRFAVPVRPARRRQGLKNALGATVNDVVMAVCAGGLRTLARRPRRAARRAARRHGAGVDPHRRGGRAVDQPRLGPLRLAADRRARPARAGPRRCTTPWSTPSSCSTPSRPSRSPTSPSSRRRRLFALGDAHGDPPAVADRCPPVTW